MTPEDVLFAISVIGCVGSVVTVAITTHRHKRDLDKERERQQQDAFERGKEAGLMRKDMETLIRSSGETNKSLSGINKKLDMMQDTINDLKSDVKLLKADVKRHEGEIIEIRSWQKSESDMYVQDHKKGQS